MRFSHGQGVELERNDGWWGPRPEWRVVTLKFLPNAGARSAALLSGAVDVIDVPSPNDLPRLRRDANFSVYAHQGMRTIYLAPDQTSDTPSAFITDVNGQPLPRNPMRDLRVRRALSIAISRDALAERVMQGTAAPTGQWLPPGTYSYNPAVTVPEFDPEEAKRLLSEAGYPRGFRLTIHTPNDVRPTDPITAQAIAQMWTRIGIQTQVDSIPNASFAARGAKREFAIGVWGWGSNSGEAGYALVNILSTPDKDRGTGSYNRAGYSNRKLDALAVQAMSTLDENVREKILQEAIAVAMGDLGIIPLYQLSNVWVTRRGLIYEASGHERTNAMAVKSAP
jgi:peptide/nickel transport system substrate-binding protein